jgi:MFS family permease
MLQLGYFRNRTFSAANAGSGMMNLGTLGALFAFSIYLQEGEGESPLIAGLHLLPWMGSLAIVAPLGGRIASSLGPRLPAGLGLAISGAGLLIAAFLPDHHGTLALIAFGLNGFGLGLATPRWSPRRPRRSRRSGPGWRQRSTTRPARQAARGVALIGAIAGIEAALAVAGAVLLVGGAIGLGLIQDGFAMRSRPQAAGPHNRSALRPSLMGGRPGGR